ncbi:DUF3108 domain-containing protein [Corticibacter populi]|nr:DUF3108 domain-containing protein [Corticibacter populi]RZS35273.1 uncharacterized protein DUF3108 [Corticibacter populi]
MPLPLQTRLPSLTTRLLPKLPSLCTLAGLLIGAALLPAPAQTVPAEAIAPPPSADMAFEVEGRISGMGYSARAQLRWQQDGEHYEAFQAIRLPLVGTRSQRSSGTLRPHFLQPLRFEDSARKRRSLRFDPASGSVIADEATQSASVPEGAQDRLSVFFQLAATVAGQPQRYVEPGRQIPIWTVANNKQEAWVFEVVEHAPITLPAGTMDAVRLQRMPRKPGDQQADIWLAPQTGYLPVRIHLSEDDGDVVDLRLRDYQAQTDTAP